VTDLSSDLLVDLERFLPLSPPLSPSLLLSPHSWLVLGFMCRLGSFPGLVFQHLSFELAHTGNPCESRAHRLFVPCPCNNECVASPIRAHGRLSRNGGVWGGSGGRGGGSGGSGGGSGGSGGGAVLWWDWIGLGGRNFDGVRQIHDQSELVHRGERT
jgi:hypothetical protein